MPADALKKLHTAMLDTREGYRVAETDAESPALKAIFSEMIALRRRDHEAIHAALTAMGETADDRGSIMGAVHKTVINVRAAVTGINDNALSSFISGEESVISEYDAALKESASRPGVHDMLAKQKAGLLAMIAKMKAEAASTP